MFQGTHGDKPSVIFRGRWALFLRALTPNQLIDLQLLQNDENSSDARINLNSYDDSHFYTITSASVTKDDRTQFFKISADLAFLCGNEEFLLSWRCDKPRDWMPFSSLIDCNIYKGIQRGIGYLPLLKLCGIVIGTPGRPVRLYPRNDGGHFLSTQLCVVDSSLKAASARALRQAAFSCREIPQFSFQHYSQGDSIYELTWPVVGQVVIATHVHVASRLVKDGAVYYNIWVESHFDGEKSLELYDPVTAPARFSELASWGRELIATQNLVDPLSQFAVIDRYGKAGMDIIVQYRGHHGHKLILHDSYQEQCVHLEPHGSHGDDYQSEMQGPFTDKSIQWVVGNVRPGCWLLLTRTFLSGGRFSVKACHIVEMPIWSLDVTQRMKRLDRKLTDSSSLLVVRD